MHVVCKAKKEFYNLPLKIKGKTKHTRVNDLPEKLSHLVLANGGKLGPTKCGELKQKERSLVVALALHPLTANQCQVKNVWKFVNKSASKYKPRLGTDSSTESADDIDDVIKQSNPKLVMQVANELLDMHEGGRAFSKKASTSRNRSL